MKSKDKHWKELSGRLRSLFEKEKDPSMQSICELMDPFDAEKIALAIEDIDTEQAMKVFQCLSGQSASYVLSMINPDLAKKILKHTDPKKAAAILKRMSPKRASTLIADAGKDQKKKILQSKKIKARVAREVEKKTQYASGTVGRLMSSKFLKIPENKTVEEALEIVRKKAKNGPLAEDIFIIHSEPSKELHKIIGVVSIWQLLTYDPKEVVDQFMEKEIITVPAHESQMDAAALLSKYKFSVLPLTDQHGNLAGVIPVDDLLQVTIARLRHLHSQAVGTDAQKIAEMSSFHEAKLRLPWLLATMVIELIAGLVIHRFDAILQKVILLASFMPVISAISGNVGLQAAAITVRALDSKIPGAGRVVKAIRRELITSFLMALACGIVLGAVGSIWSKHLPFGLVIGGALICSMLTAGLMGTIIPMISKLLKFDPATTAGPFETAFQDIVGFFMFLWLATIFQHWIT